MDTQEGKQLAIESRHVGFIRPVPYRQWRNWVLYIRMSVSKERNEICSRSDPCCAGIGLAIAAIQVCTL